MTTTREHLKLLDFREATHRELVPDGGMNGKWPAKSKPPEDVLQAIWEDYTDTREESFRLGLFRASLVRQEFTPVVQGAEDERADEIKRNRHAIAASEELIRAQARRIRNGLAGLGWRG